VDKKGTRLTLVLCLSNMSTQISVSRLSQFPILEIWLHLRIFLFCSFPPRSDLQIFLATSNDASINSRILSFCPAALLPGILSVHHFLPSPHTDPHETTCRIGYHISSPGLRVSRVLWNIRISWLQPDSVKYILRHV
jgi:hypothetical protein